MVGALVMIRPFAIVIVNCLLAVTPLASVTWAVKLKVPWAMGVPVMAPVEPLSIKFAGSAPIVMDQL